MKTRGRCVAITTGLVALVVLGLGAYLGWPHLVFWYRFAYIGLNAQGLPEYRHRKTGIVMVRLPGGTFLMGAQRADPNRPNYDPEAGDNEGPVHDVALSPFLIAKHEVTQGQWKMAIRLNPSHFRGDDQPVEQVSWGDIQEFERRTGLFLPTEAQWEFACRAGSKTPYAGTERLNDMGWYDKNSGDTSHPVGGKASNRFGLLDMHGNVWEWCEDILDEGFYGKKEAREPDPVATSGSLRRVLRGGSWGAAARGCRSSHRMGFPPDERGGYLGFRLASPWP